ncbi:IclR family transcriptional regulator [Arthrobacter sp. NPDC090010]|uniref:IclR family transcriptional regulator n=1 Tax=Arthrobacter sp. NPDC090010 TaxID=3363942 RepID=UPI0037FD6490
MVDKRRNAQVPSAYEVLSVLEFIGTQLAPVRASTIARELNLPRSTTYHLLAALVDQGFVTHLPEERRYALGPVAHELGTGYARHVPLQRLATHPMADLVRRSRNTAHLTVMRGREVIYIIEQRAPRKPSLVTHEDVRLPAHLTASGRAMLAWMPESQVSAIYAGERELSRRTDVGPATVDELLEMLTHMRQAGYAWEAEEVTLGLLSLAAPIFDRTGHPVASVALTVSAADLTHGSAGIAEPGVPQAVVGATAEIRELGLKYARQIRGCAGELTRRLGATSATN